MSTFFLNLTACAAVGSVSSGVFFLLRHGTRRLLGANKQYRFWLLLLILWVLPLRFALPVPAWEESRENPSVNPPAVPAVTEVYRSAYTPAEIRPASGNDVPDESQSIASVLPFLRCVWGFGIPAALCFQCIPYIRFRRLLKKTALPADVAVSVRAGIPVYSSAAVDSPMVVGLFRPALYMPDHTYTDEELACILRHEWNHTARRDIPLKWFAAAVRCLHWWNPLVHLAVRQFAEECEISCDFRTSAEMSGEQRIVYMRLLLDLAEERCRKREFLTTGFSDSKQFLKRRLLMIQNGKKQKIFTTVLSSLLLAGLSAGLICGSGVFRDAVLPEETELPETIPAVDSMTNTETMPAAEPLTEETYTAVREELKQELASLQEEISAFRDLETDSSVPEENTEVYVDPNEVGLFSAADDRGELYADAMPQYETELPEVPTILKPDREINLEYGFSSPNRQTEEYFHKDVDFKGTVGESVPSASAGEILYMGYDYSYGNMIIVKSGAYEICYAHLSEFAPGLAEGDSVEIGTVIGEIGQTGAVTGPNLHFEVRLDGQVIDPASVWVE